MTDGYDLWLFDLDGTLVDVEREYALSVIEQTGQKIDYRFTEEEALQLWYGLGGAPEDHLRRRGVDPIDFWEAFHVVEDPETRLSHTYLYADAEVVSDIGSPVGLVTHCQPYLAEPVLEALDIADWFDVIICCNDEIGWKPDPRPIEQAMRGLGAPADATGALVGDSPGDIGAAWNAGLDGIHLERHGHDARGCCIRADVRLTGCDELPFREGYNHGSSVASAADD